MTKAYGKFASLPNVREEIDGIVKPRGILPGETLLDEGFTWNAMKNSLRKRYSLVHIASHFNFTPGNDTESYLLLGDGTSLPLSAMKTQTGVFGGVELLTLSARNTASGDEMKDKDGKEVEGFAVLAQRQGAKAVVATLWPVADESTSLLMREFYKLREAKKLTKGEALRQAQMTLLTGKTQGDPAKNVERAANQLKDEKAPPKRAKTFRIDPEKPFAHPYYWAPFILMGNWK